MKLYFILAFAISIFNMEGQTLIKYGDKKYMIDVAKSGIQNDFDKFNLRKDLNNGTYIILNKKDTVAIVKLKNHFFDGKQVYFQIVNNKSERYYEKYYQNDSLKKMIGYAGLNNISFITNYLNGIKNGEEIHYFNSTITRYVFYKNDSIVKWVNYYKNGIIMSEGFGDFTYRTGSLLEYHENGVIGRIINFQNGIPSGFTKYNDEGKLVEVGCLSAYEGDLKEAYSRSYNDRSKYISTQECKSIFFDNNGKRLE